MLLSDVVDERRKILGLPSPSQGHPRPYRGPNVKAKQRREMNRTLQEHAPLRDTEDQREYVRWREELKHEELRLREARRDRDKE